MIVQRHGLTVKFALISLAMLAAMVSTVRADRPPAAKLLPQHTVAVVSVADAQELARRHKNTSIGRMSQDPQLKPLIGQLYGALSEATAQLKEVIGLSLTELLAIPQGEITVALVSPEEAPLAVVVLLDAGNQLSNARTVIERLTAMLDSSNAIKLEETIAGTTIVVYDGVGPENRQVAYFEKDATIVFGTDLDVLKEILAVWDGGDAAPLAENRSFAAVMQRCRGPRNEPPQIIWYADPIELIRSIGRDNTGVRVAVAMFPALGLDGLTAVGGSLTVDAKQFESVMHAHLLLENPRSGVLKMIALKSGDVTPEPWVPADVATYMTVHWDVQKTYNTLALLYDSFRGDGALAKALEQRILGPTGIDFEKDVIDSLDGRITMLTWIERPITLQSQAILLGLKLKDTAPLEEALQKVIKLSQGNLIEKTYAGKKYYQVREPEQLAQLSPNSRPPMPCFGIVEGYLLAINRAGLMEKIILTTTGGGETLADQLDFKLIASKISRQPGGDRPAMIAFDSPEESLRFVYELATSEDLRAQLREGAANVPFLKVLEKALEDNPLPPFAVLQQYLAPSGGMVVDDETGIHYMAFGLKRKPD